MSLRIVAFEVMMRCSRRVCRCNQCSDGRRRLCVKAVRRVVGHLPIDCSEPVDSDSCCDFAQHRVRGEPRWYSVGANCSGCCVACAEPLGHRHRVGRHGDHNQQQVDATAASSLAELPCVTHFQQEELSSFRTNRHVNLVVKQRSESDNKTDDDLNKAQVSVPQRPKCSSILSGL